MSKTTTDYVFDFIVSYINKNSFPPSQREIAEGCYITRGAVPRHLRKLEEQQQIARIPGVTRSIRILDKNNHNNEKSKK